MMLKHFVAAALLALPAAAFAQAPAELQKLFEAGRYQQVVDAAAPSPDPAAQFLAAQSQQKLGAADQATATYARLAARPAGDPWHFIGVSGQQLTANDVNGALASAQQAVATPPAIPEANYQLGLVLAKRQQWAEAAAAFDAAAAASPSNAYAHYYGGLMHYRANRPDRMAIHFEQFLKLAPEAPERPEVMQIMKTVRGR